MADVIERTVLSTIYRVIRYGVSEQGAVALPEVYAVPTTIVDLWFLTYEGCRLDIRGPLFNSRQIDGEIRRANTERRHGRTDWMAVNLEEVILVYAEPCFGTIVDQVMRDLGRKRHQ